MRLLRFVVVIGCLFEIAPGSLRTHLVGLAVGCVDVAWVQVTSYWRCKSCRVGHADNVEWAMQLGCRQRHMVDVHAEQVQMVGVHMAEAHVQTSTW